MDAGLCAWQHEQAFERNWATTRRAHLNRPVVNTFERAVEGREIDVSQAKKRRHLGALVGDRRTLRIVLVIRRRQLGGLDDAGEAPLQRCDLDDHAASLDLDRGS